MTVDELVTAIRRLISKNETTTSCNLATKIPKPMAMIKNSKDKKDKKGVDESLSTYSYYQASRDYPPKGKPMGYSVDQRMTNTTAAMLGYKIPEALDPAQLQEGDRVIVLTKKGEPISQGYVSEVSEYDVVVSNFDQKNSYSKESYCFRYM